MQKQLWNLKQAAEPDVLELYIYDYIEGDWYDWWAGEVIRSETSANFFRDELAKYPDAKQINLFVNSYGGYVYEAMAIRNQLKRHSARVVGYVDGFAASAATFVLTACDEVRMYSNTMQRPHNMLLGAYGNAEELRAVAEELDKLMEGNRQAYLEKCNGKITEEKLVEILAADQWLTAEECLEFGFCDTVIEEEKDLTEATMILDKHNQSMQQQLDHRNAIQALMQSLSGSNKPREPKMSMEDAVNKNKQLMAALVGGRTGEE